MFELDIRAVRDDWASQSASMPEPFTLVGYESPYVLATGGRAPLVIDAEGVVLISGAVFTWCRTGCCGSSPRQWPSVEAAADFHGSYVINADGTVRAADDEVTP